jgi:hypothetical protein
MHPPVEPDEPGVSAAQHGNGAEAPAQTDGAPGLQAPLVPQPGQAAAVPPAPAPVPSPAPPPAEPEPAPAAEHEQKPGGPTDGQAEVGEQVTETLTDAVRQRIRRALSTSGGTAAERREHGKVDTGDTVPDDGGAGRNSAGDQDGPGSDSPGSSPFSAGNDPGV